MILSLRTLACNLGLASFLSCLVLAASGCGDESGGKTDAPVLSPRDAASDLRDTQVDRAAPDAPVMGPEVSTLDLEGGEAPAREAGPPPLDAQAPLDSGPSALDGPGVDAGRVTSPDASIATPSCTSLVNPVFILTGDVHVPLFRQVGKLLRAQPDPITLVWVTTDACSMVATVYAGDRITPNGSYIPADPTWDVTSGSLPTCSMPAGGVPADLAAFCGDPLICGLGPTPAGLELVTGPVQSFIYIVPKASTATAISAEEAYLVFGFGENGGVAPWTNPSFYFIRNPTAGVQIVLGLAIGVPAAKWQGQRLKGMAADASSVATSSAPDQTIGILGTEVYDSAANRAVLKSLSFQAYGQELGYLPDSLPSTFDKRNVRDGHYVASTHVFYLMPVDILGARTNPRAKRLVDLFTDGPGAASAGIDSVALVANNGLVPSCAMTVQRRTEGADLEPYAPVDLCGCAFEAAVGSAPTACVPCASDTDCVGARCMHGYCEAADGRTSLGDCSPPGADYTSILNSPCSGRFASPKRPMPGKQIDNGGVLPPLP